MMLAESPPLEKASEGSGFAFRVPAWLRTEGFHGQEVVPLLVDGRSVGALMVGMRQTGTLDGDGMRLLRLMGNQAAMAIEKARLHEEEVKAQGLERELSVGRQIQLSLLPKAPPVVPGWDFAAFYEAARLVGGDFYDFFELPGEPGRLGIVIADVAGKGVPAALFMALSRTIIRASALNGRGPAAALVRANELILEDSRSDLFLTAFYAVLDTHTGRLVYANAGHNPPLWLHTTTRNLQELTARGIVLGALEEIELEEREIEVEPGDLLVFYTDGATEAMDANRQPFGEERLQAAIATKADASPEEVLGTVVDRVRAFTGDIPAADDMTFCAIRRCPESV
jgi:sigma-B regulation protein RsbU (phosphoserine phosphatase)